MSDKNKYYIQDKWEDLKMIPMVNGFIGVFSNSNFGVRFLLGNCGNYTPDPKPTPPTDGGAPVGGSNIIPFKRKTNVYNTQSNQYRRAA